MWSGSVGGWNSIALDDLPLTAAPSRTFSLYELMRLVTIICRSLGAAKAAPRCEFWAVVLGRLALARIVAAIRTRHPDAGTIGLLAAMGCIVASIGSIVWTLWLVFFGLLFVLYWGPATIFPDASQPDGFPTNDIGPIIVRVAPAAFVVTIALLLRDWPTRRHDRRSATGRSPT